jgi:hypothetical protein
MTPELLPPRMAAKVTIDAHGCWIWSGAVQSRGYASVGIAGRSHLGHRVAYELLVGPIPDALTLDHLCRVKTRLNPAHLEPVDVATNVRRARESVADCVHGHPFTQGNTYVTTRGTRECRTCRNDRSHSRRLKAA